MSIAEESKDLFGFLDELKKCTECGEMLPLTMFAKDSGANYHKGKCKPCTKKHDTQLKELKKKQRQIILHLEGNLKSQGPFSFMSSHISFHGMEIKVIIAFWNGL